MDLKGSVTARSNDEMNSKRVGCISWNPNFIGSDSKVFFFTHNQPMGSLSRESGKQKNLISLCIRTRQKKGES